MQLWQERVVAEKAALDLLLDKLLAFIRAQTFADLHIDDQDLLREQANHMIDYTIVLARRIKRFVG